MPRTTKVQVVDQEGKPVTEGDLGSLSVERTIRVLRAFRLTQPVLSLADISAQAQLNKATALRIARTLAMQEFLVQRDDGRWRLGAAAGLLGAQYQHTFDVDDAITPLLRKLARSTGESSSLFVREGNVRVCLLRVESTLEERAVVHPGTTFPLNKGAPGGVILAFSGQPGQTYEQIRRLGFHIAVRERAAEAASVAAPVFGSNWQLLGAISISGSAERLTHEVLQRHAQAVVQAAKKASQLLGGSFTHSSKR